ncbi:MAG: hypothetical protein XE11_2838 [Methanomicrobiales archaeon 53_19]|nr:MAG: hypothetical protein XE11_2838 [Methanomicrobiales archaeon 53_19]
MSTLKKRIKHHQGLPEVVPRLVFIQLRYTGMSVVKAAKSIGVSGQTGYNWQERWNADGLEGLVPRYAGGRPAKLTADQKAALLERLRENDHWTTVEAQQLIQSQFGVTYSLDQVRRILKSFGTKIRANTFAILAVNGTSIATFRERSKQEGIREVLREYKRANPNKRLAIVLDNFSSHHAILVRKYAAGNNIRLAYLPP